MLKNGIVEIIRVTLAVVLQFVEEVEHVESEHCRRAFESRWEPTGAKELNMFGNVAMAMAVTNDEAMSA